MLHFWYEKYFLIKKSFQQTKEIEISLVEWNVDLYCGRKVKSNLSLYSLYHAEACNEFAGPNSASLRPGNIAPFKEMSQRWLSVGNTM